MKLQLLMEILLRYLKKFGEDDSYEFKISACKDEDGKPSKDTFCVIEKKIKEKLKIIKMFTILWKRH